MKGKKYEHPYDLKTARWLRKHLVMEKSQKKKKEFLENLEGVFGHRFAEILRYISKDYRVIIRDDQMWSDFDDPSWTGAIWCCGRALT